MNPNINIFDIKKKSKSELSINVGILEDQCQKQIENDRKTLMSNN